MVWGSEGLSMICLILKGGDKERSLPGAALEPRYLLKALQPTKTGWSSGIHFKH